jgi:hypothetical protein
MMKKENDNDHKFFTTIEVIKSKIAKNYGLLMCFRPTGGVKCKKGDI